MQHLKVLSYNMHKGRSFWLRNYSLGKIKQALMSLSPDIIFLQEMPGVHLGSWMRENNPLEELADALWSHYSFGMNAVATKTEHGNAILSKFPITFTENLDISKTSFAKRGLLHTVVEVDSQELHLLCCHLDLIERARQQQGELIAERIQDHVPPEAAMILAGDFNDWRHGLEGLFKNRLKLKSCSNRFQEKPPLTFPAHFPLFSLDRIYLRGLTYHKTQVIKGKPWVWLSDHLPLMAECSLTDSNNSEELSTEPSSISS